MSAGAPASVGERAAADGAALRPRVLVIDDGLEYARLVREHMPEVTLVQPGPGETRLRDGPDALAFLDRHAADVDVVLLDVKFDVPEDRLLPLPGASLRRTRRFQGVAILGELRARHPTLPVVLLTAVEDLSLVDVDGQLAGQSMTYFLDRDDLDTLRIRVAAALAHRDEPPIDDGVLWGTGAALGALRRRLAVLSRGTMPVILEGETGTGKSFLAERFVHPQSGRPGPFVVLDLSTIPADLVAAHLFGARRGAYTGSVADRPGVFEAAHGGTLFLDEIQNVPLEIQKQLLVVLQERRVRPLGATEQIDVDVKVVAGSNVPLDRAVAEGRFRQDLYMRLGPATRLRLPPLRERPEDLPLLLHHFVAAAAAHPDNAALVGAIARACGLGPGAGLRLRIGRPGARAPAEVVAAGDLELVLPAPASALLAEHRWPGNVRELAMVVHHLVSFTLVAAMDAMRDGVPVRAPRLQVDPGWVGELLAASGSGAPADDAVDGDDLRRMRVEVHAGPSLHAVQTDVERQVLTALFERTRGDFARMADLLLGDPTKARAVRLRFNQIGLKVRELRS